jgi:transposase
MNMRYLGIDVAEKTLAVCLLDESSPYHAEFANTPAGHKQLLRWVAHRVAAAEVWVGMEATGRYYEAVATACHTAGYRVSVLNPARVAFYARSRLKRTKQDHVDSHLIAQFLMSEQPHLWQPTPPAYYELQELVRRLDDLKKMRQQERNRFKAGITSAIVQTSVQHHITLLDQQIADLERDIHAHIAHHPDLKRRRDLLDSIPGIAELTAAKLLGELGDLTRFASAQALAAYVGLCPQHHQSGTSVHKRTRLSRTGNGALRHALYFPALSAMRHNPILKAFADRLHANHKTKMQVVAAVMRKLLHLAFGVVKSNRPFDPTFLAHRHAALAPP